MTYIPTLAGFLYLAVVLDVWSRKIVGWAMSSRLVTQVALDAFSMALEQRGPVGVSHHSDQGCATLDGIGGRLLRQRDVRELLPPRSNMSCSTGPVHRSSGSRAGRVRVHRGLLQHFAAIPPSATVHDTAVHTRKTTRILGHGDAQTRMFPWTRENNRFALSAWNQRDIAIPDWLSHGGNTGSNPVCATKYPLASYPGIATLRKPAESAWGRT